MKRILFILLCLTTLISLKSLPIAAQQSNQNRFDQLRQRSFISDYKAMGVGDAVKILIVEATEAGNSAGTNESHNSNLKGSAGVGASTSSTTLGGNVTLGTGDDFSGGGSNTRKESIKSQLTAKVTSIDERGNYMIEGKRVTTIDGEAQTITLKGTIRPADIMANNAIYSYNIMDMELSIVGDGNATKMNKPGLITRFLRLLF
jgi:flagellar L-ring protein precursor FlgH